MRSLDFESSASAIPPRRRFGKRSEEYEFCAEAQTPNALDSKDCTSTGSWGAASGATTKADAIANAIAKCNCPDADVRTNWCRNAWIALAISNQSKGGWGSAWGETPEIAKSKAMAECLARNPDAHVVLYVSSK